MRNFPELRLGEVRRISFPRTRVNKGKKSRGKTRPRVLLLGIGSTRAASRRNFSRSWTVASRNSLYQTLAINIALGPDQRAKSCSPRPIGTGVWNKAGEIATANFVEFLY
jgi:hypothetical protein